MIMIIIKQNYMPELKLTQLQFESDTWKRLLAFIADENMHLKKRLTEILKEEFDKSMLEDAENFQTKFLKEDNLIILLRNEVAELDNWLEREIFENGTLKKEVNKRIRKIRKNIKYAEAQFEKLKSEFNNYFSEN